VTAARVGVGWAIRSMNRVLAGLSIFVAFIPALAQLAKVEGVVVNGATGGAVAGAMLRLCEQPKSNKTMATGICTMAYSGHDGRFAFTKAKAGHFYLEGESNGYLRDYLVLNGRGGSDFDLHAGETR